jgi:hypothetical protein
VDTGLVVVLGLSLLMYFGLSGYHLGLYCHRRRGRAGCMFSQFSCSASSHLSSQIFLYLNLNGAVFSFSSRPPKLSI